MTPIWLACRAPNSSGESPGGAPPKSDHVKAQGKVQGQWPWREYEGRPSRFGPFSLTLSLAALGVALMLIAPLLAACDPVNPAATATLPWATSPPPLGTPEMLPVAPLVEGPAIRDPGMGAEGVSNPTLAGLAAEGQPIQDLPTSTPLPTVAQLPIMISAQDGRVLRGVLYGAPIRPSPGVLLLHDRNEDRHVWDALAGQLQAAGYSVLAVDLRGSGETGGRADWTLARDDVRAALAQLAEFPGVGTSGLAVIGAGYGANLGLDACADTPRCAAAVLLSAGLDYAGLTTADAMARLGLRPVLVVAGENDDNNPADSFTLANLAAGDHTLVVLPDAGHGSAMLGAVPDLSDRILAWLLARLPPPIR